MMMMMMMMMTGYTQRAQTPPRLLHRVGDRRCTVGEKRGGAPCLVKIHRESKKLDPFSFEHNFGKYCPILIILSLWQTEINYDKVYHKIYYHTQICYCTTL